MNIKELIKQIELYEAEEETSAEFKEIEKTQTKDDIIKLKFQLCHACKKIDFYKRIR